jgi:hypothetical protein
VICLSAVTLALAVVVSVGIVLGLNKLVYKRWL